MPEARPDAASATAGSPGRVLVVDDNELNRELLEQELTDLGFEVRAVESGAACLDEVPRFEPDAVVLDIQMPGMNGFEVLERLRASHGQLELPVVMATALTGTDDVVTAFDKGANDYVTKPIDVAVLVARLRTLLRVRAARPRAPAAPTGGFATLRADDAAPRAHEAQCGQCCSVRAEDEPFCTSCGASRPARGWPAIDRARHPWLGRTIGERYHLDRFLDGGGQGQVYRAQGLDLGREFAAKLVDLQAEDPADLERLRGQLVNEVQTMVNLRSPHVVQIYEVVRVSDTVYALVMEWVGGLSLERWIGALGPMSPRDALTVARQVALGLHELHRHGMVHRDVKPANIMVEQLQGGGIFAKLLDFGISGRARADAASGQFVGSVHFAAPEQARPEQGSDKRADLYALGCTLWYALTGELPFAGGEARAVLRRHAREMLPPVDVRRTADPLLTRCDGLIAELTRKVPEERVRDVPALLERVDRLLQGGELAAAAPSRPVLELRRRLGRGGYGEVYRGRMQRDGGVSIEVAIKLLHPDVGPDPEAAARLRDEGRLLAALNHPAIVKIHDLTEHDDRVALVTEFVDGRDLADCVRGEHRIPRRALYEALELVAGGLDAAWSTRGPAGGPLRLVHRDVKPRNIRIGRHGDVKLLDFGISRAENLELEHMTGHGVTGTRLYMAPERFEGIVGPEGDVFALGCVLYEALSGERLLASFMPDQLLAARYRPQPWEQYLQARMELVPSEVEPEARHLIRSMIALDRAERPTAGEVAARLAALGEQAPSPGLRAWCREVDLGAANRSDPTLLQGTRASDTMPYPEPAEPSVETLASPPAAAGWTVRQRLAAGLGLLAAITLVVYLLLG